MKPTLSPLLTIAAIFAFSLLPAAAAEPDADQLLRQMSAKLAAAQSFSFEAKREIDPALTEGSPVPQKANVSVSVLRPNKIDAVAVSKSGTRHFIADGRTLTLLDARSNHYATVPMRTTIDGLVEKLDTKFGFVPPLADFAVSNPYAELRRQAKTITYLGVGKTKAGFLGLGGVQCHRIALQGKVADAELWIGVNDQLPYKMVATFHLDGQPQLRIAFSHWNLTAPATAATFAFTPPPGAQKIEMMTTAQMEATSRKR